MSTQMDDDESDLLARARAHDPDAWEAIYRRAYPGLVAFARRRLATREQADDAVSEVMARAIGAVDRLTLGAAGIDGWLYGILRNVVLETYRVRPPVAEPAVDPAAPDRGPLERVVAGEEATLVRRAFSRLPDSDREVLELRVVAGLGAEAVGEVLGKRSGAVRMAQARALGRLRANLQEAGA